MFVLPYARSVGTRLYLANNVRPDIALASSVLSRYMVDPGLKHRNCAEHVLNYLNGTFESEILFGRGKNNPQLVGIVTRATEDARTARSVQVNMC